MGRRALQPRPGLHVGFKGVALLSILLGCAIIPGVVSSGASWYGMLVARQRNLLTVTYTLELDTTTPVTVNEVAPTPGAALKYTGTDLNLVYKATLTSDDNTANAVGPETPMYWQVEVGSSTPDIFPAGTAAAPRQYITPLGGNGRSFNVPVTIKAAGEIDVVVKACSAATSTTCTALATSATETIVVEDGAYTLSGGAVTTAFTAGEASTDSNGFGAVTVAYPATHAGIISWKLFLDASEASNVANAHSSGDSTAITAGTAGTFTISAATLRDTAGITYDSIGPKTALVAIYAGTALLRTMTISHTVAQNSQINGAARLVLSTTTPKVNNLVEFTLSPAKASFLKAGATGTTNWQYELLPEVSATTVSGAIADINSATFSATYTSGGSRTARFRVYDNTPVATANVLAEATVTFLVLESGLFATSGSTILTSPTSGTFTGRKLTFTAKVATVTGTQATVYYTFDAGDGTGESATRTQIANGGVTTAGVTITTNLADITYRTPGTYTAKLRLYSASTGGHLFQTLSFPDIQIKYDTVDNGGVLTLSLSPPAINPITPPTASENEVDFKATVMIKDTPTAKTLYWAFQKDSEYGTGYYKTGDPLMLDSNAADAVNKDTATFDISDVAYYAHGPAAGKLYIFDGSNVATASVLAEASVSLTVEDSAYALALDTDSDPADGYAFTTADSISFTATADYSYADVTTAYWAFDVGQTDVGIRPTGVDAANARNLVTFDTSAVTLPMPDFKYSSPGTKTAFLRLYDAATGGNLLRSVALSVVVEDSRYTITLKRGATPAATPTITDKVTFDIKVASSVGTKVFWSLQRDTGITQYPDGDTTAFIEITPTSAGLQISDLLSLPTGTATMLQSTLQALYASAGTKKLTFRVYSANKKDTATLLRTATLDLAVEDGAYTLTLVPASGVTANSPLAFTASVKHAISTDLVFYTFQSEASGSESTPRTSVTPSAGGASISGISKTYTASGAKTATLRIYSALTGGSLLRTVSVTVEDGAYTLTLVPASGVAKGSAMAFTASVTHATSTAPVFYTFESDTSANSGKGNEGTTRTSVTPSDDGTAITGITNIYNDASGAKTAILRIYSAATGGTLLRAVTAAVIVEDSTYTWTPANSKSSIKVGEVLTFTPTFARAGTTAATGNEVYTIQKDDGVESRSTDAPSAVAYSSTTPGSKVITLRLYSPSGILLRTKTVPITVTKDPDYSVSAQVTTPASGTAVTTSDATVELTISGTFKGSTGDGVGTAFFTVHSDYDATAINAESGFNSAGSDAVETKAYSLMYNLGQYAKAGTKNVVVRMYDADPAANAATANMLTDFTLPLTVSEDTAYTLAIEPKGTVRVGETATFTATLKHTDKTKTLTCKIKYTDAENAAEVAVTNTLVADGKAADLTTGSPYSYSETGLQTATLNCYDAAGTHLIRTATVTFSVERNDYYLVLGISNDDPEKGTPVTFYSYVAHPSIVTPVFWTIDFQDGTPESTPVAITPTQPGSQIVIPDYTYTEAAGLQTATLRIYSDAAKTVLLQSKTSSVFTLLDPAYTITITPSIAAPTTSDEVSFTVKVAHGVSTEPVFWTFSDDQSATLTVDATRSVAPSEQGTEITAISEIKVQYTTPDTKFISVFIYDKSDGTGVLLREVTYKLSVGEDTSYTLSLTASKDSVLTSDEVTFTASVKTSATTAVDPVFWSFVSDYNGYDPNDGASRTSVTPTAAGAAITFPKLTYNTPGKKTPALLIYDGQAADSSLLRVFELASPITVSEDLSYTVKFTVATVPLVPGSAAAFTASVAHETSTASVFYKFYTSESDSNPSSGTLAAVSKAGAAIAGLSATYNSAGKHVAKLEIYKAENGPLLHTITTTVHVENTAYTLSLSAPSGMLNPVAGQAIAMVATVTMPSLDDDETKKVYYSFQSGLADDPEVPLGASAATLRAPAVITSDSVTFTLPSVTYPKYAASMKPVVRIYDSPVGGTVLRSAVMAATVEDPAYSIALGPSTTTIALGTSVAFTASVKHPTSTTNVFWSFDADEASCAKQPADGVARSSVAPSATGKAVTLTACPYVGGVGKREAIFRLYSAATNTDANTLLRSAMMVLTVGEDTHYALDIKSTPASISTTTEVTFAVTLKAIVATASLGWSFDYGETGKTPTSGTVASVAGDTGVAIEVPKYTYPTPGEKTLTLKLSYAGASGAVMRTMTSTLTVIKDASYSVDLAITEPKTAAELEVLAPVMFASSLKHAASGATVYYSFDSDMTDSSDTSMTTRKVITPSTTGTALGLTALSSGFSSAGAKSAVVNVFSAMADGTGSLLQSFSLDFTVLEDTAYTATFAKVHPATDPTTAQTIILSASTTNADDDATTVYYLLDGGEDTFTCDADAMESITPGDEDATTLTLSYDMPGKYNAVLRLYKDDDCATYLRSFTLPITVTEELAYGFVLAAPSASVPADTPVKLSVRMTRPNPGNAIVYYAFNSGEPGVADSALTYVPLWDAFKDGSVTNTGTFDLPATTYSTPGLKTATLKVYNDNYGTKLLRSAQLAFTVEDPALSLAISKTSPAADPQVNEDITLLVTATRTTLVTTPIFCSFTPSGGAESTRVQVTPTPSGAAFSSPTLKFDAIGAATVTVTCYDAATGGGIVRTGSIGLNVVPVTTTQTSTVSVQVRLLAPFPSTPEALETFKTDFVTQMKRILNARDIIIKRVYEGSIVVEFDALVNGDSAVANNALNAFLANPQAAFSSDFLSAYQVTGVEARRVDPVAAEEDDDKKSSTGLIVGLVVGLVGGAIVITLLALFIVHRRRNQAQSVAPTANGRSGNNAVAPVEDKGKIDALPV